MKRVKKIKNSTLKFIKKRWKIILLVLVIAVGVGFWWYRSQNSKADAVNFEQVERKDLVKTLEVSGVVDAKGKARLRFIAGGKVTYIGASTGDFVKKWQTIATIDKAALEKQLDQELNAYMKERWDFESTQDTTDYHVEDLSTRRSLDKEQWDLENTVLTVEIRDIAIRNSSIYAPFDGILVVSPTVVPGAQLLSTDYFEIVDPSTLIFRAEVDEDDIGQLALGQSTTFELDAYNNEINDSIVNYISYISTQTASGNIYFVEVPILSEDVSHFRLGMNGDATIKIDERSDVLVVPIEATISRDGKTYVEVKTGDKTFEEREIEVGMETEDEVEVISGLTESDQIVIPE